MKKVIVSILVCILASGHALADSAQVSALTGLGMSPELAAKVDSFYSSSVATNEVFQAGKGLVFIPYVPTMAATPVGGTNLVKEGLSVVPTAAASTAAFLGAVTPTPGAQFLIHNNSGAAIRIKAAGGATMNGAGTVGAAGTYIGMAANTTLHCFTQSGTAQVCDSYSAGAVPTPAGP